MLSMHIIGAGRLGATLGYLLHTHNLVAIKGVCNRTLLSAQKAVDKMGTGEPCLAIPHLSNDADIILLATPDDAMLQVATLLTSSQSLVNKVVFHVSGALSSSQLQVLKQQGAWVASVHPMASFSHHTTLSDLQGVYCTLEGDQEALNVLTPLFQALQATLIEITADKKIHYHLGGVYASNYLIALFELAIQHFAIAGIAKKEAYAIAASLIQNTLTNLEKAESTSSALTGPLVRGDINTLKLHLQALTEEESALYKALAKLLLPLAHHSTTTKEQLLHFLTGNPS